MEDIYTKKAFEITYALFRVADRVYRPKFGAHLEDFGMELLKSAAFGDKEEIARSGEAIKLALNLGAGAGILNHSNSELIIQEIDGLLAALADEKKTNLPEADIAGLFTPLRQGEYKISGNLQENEEIAELPDRAIQGTKESKVIIDEATPNRKDVAVALSAVPGLGSQMRQSAIVEKVAEVGECRLKDIQSLLPDTSERTLRYDLQTLIEEGVIERVGSSGPSTFYRIPGKTLA